MTDESPASSPAPRWRCDPLRVGLMAAAGCATVSLLLVPLMLLAGPGLGTAAGAAGHGVADHAIASGAERFDDLAVTIVATPLLYALGGFVLGAVTAYIITLRARAQGGVHIELS